MVQRVIRAGQIERVLAKIYGSLFDQIKTSDFFPWDLNSVKREFNDAVYSRTRTAVTEAYTVGINYVGSKTNSDVYLGDSDLSNIKEATNNAVTSFWNRITEDARRTREQEIEAERKQKDRATTAMLATTSTVAVTSALAVSTLSKTKQVIEEPSPTPESESDQSQEQPPKPQIKWVAQLDEKTCQILPNGEPGCASLDGTVWDYDDPEIPVPGRLGPNGTHPNCRCYLDLQI